MTIQKRTEREPVQRSNAGFTLLEVMFASTIFVVLIVFLFGSLLQFYMVQEVTKQRSIALAHIGTVIEELQSLNIDELLEYVPPELSGLGEEVEVSAEYIDEEEEFHLLPLEEIGDDLQAGLPNPLEVRVSMHWIDRRGQEYRRSASTMVGW